jgi:hypothetical protein
MDPRRAQRSSEICAMAGLARYYAGNCENLELVCREMLALIDHRWGLADDERVWCVEILADDQGLDRPPIEVVRHTHGILSGDDYALLANCLGWFGGEDRVMTALVGDLSSIGLSVTTTIELFPENVCTAFQQLDLEPTLNVAEIDKVYREWAKLLHPDATVSVDLSAQERHDAEALLRRISSARDVIRTHLRTFVRPDGLGGAAAPASR